MAIAQETYKQRKYHMVDTGWGQAINDAACLNLSADAAAQVASRAAVQPAIGYRFRGFSQAYEDVAPSMDHFSFMRTAVNLMLLLPVDDAAGSAVLLPAWPCAWNVSFSLHAPRQTVVAGSLLGGKLSYTVTPAARRPFIKALPCQ